MKDIIQTDIVIVGGGIAGLWLLTRLRQCGFSVILLESDRLGGGQTHKAQGIIHSGMKYALQGQSTTAAQAIADMPVIWQGCLQGRGEIDLSNVPILSKQHYLWSTGSFASTVAGFLAGLSLKSTIQTLDKKDFPEIFQHPQFHGQVYSIDETVIDVHALLRELMMLNQNVIFKIDPMDESQIELDDKDRLVSFNIHGASMKTVQVNAQKYIFTAGKGNELVLGKLKQHKVSAQRRPLHMVMVKHYFDYPLYAHCLGLGATPRLTITTHKAKDGRSIWYLGGKIAEEGVALSSEEQVQLARKELKKLFSWLDFSKSEFASFYIDRAENLQPNGSRPDSCSVREIENMIVAWPTKLAFAPLLAREVIQCLLNEAIQPCAADLRELHAWPVPDLAKPMWDSEQV